MNLQIQQVDIFTVSADAIFLPIDGLRQAWSGLVRLPETRSSQGFDAFISVESDTISTTGFASPKESSRFSRSGIRTVELVHGCSESMVCSYREVLLRADASVALLKNGGPRSRAVKH